MTGWQYLNEENKGRLPGVIFSVGHYWKTLRRFMFRNLRDVGFGKSSMEELFIEEVRLYGKKVGHLFGLKERLQTKV